MHLFKQVNPRNWMIATKITIYTLGINLACITAIAIALDTKTQRATFEREEQGLNVALEDGIVRIEHEITIVRHQLEVFAQDPAITEAAAGFSASFGNLAEQHPVEGTANKLSEYFDRSFKPGMQEQGQSYRGASSYIPTDENARVAQWLFLGDNPHPVGSKHNLVVSGAETEYDTVHGEYHEYFRHFLESFGLYDIFIVSTDGDIVYSVFKEVDFATNLLDGPYSQSGLADAFRMGLAVGQGNTTMTDFAPYEPSYGAAAAFTASPIYEGDDVVGVLCFQMPVGSINEAMARDIGETGRLHLIGSDLRLRSARDESDDVIFETQMSTDGAKLAASGETGIVRHTDPEGVAALAAFTPIHIDGVEWFILAEISESEVLAPAVAIRKMIIGVAIAAALLIIPIAIGFARMFASPIKKTVEQTKLLASGDFTTTLELNRRDELGILSDAMNSMSGNIGSMISDVAGAAHEVAGAATEIAATSQQMAQGLDNQEKQTNESSAAVEELSSSIASVAEKSTHAADSAANAGTEAEDGGKVVADTITEMQGIAEQVRQSVAAVDSLGVKSEQIGEIIAVINDIADQTNLLALNAAIEAARAGEHGRGFAVVADEVRKLAERTTTATEQVSTSIREIQSDTKSAITQIEQGSSRVESGVQMASKAGGSLDRIVDASNTLKSMVQDIAHAIEEQTIGARQIAEATSGIVSVTRESASAASEANSAANNLSEQSERLLSLTSQFKVSA